MQALFYIDMSHNDSKEAIKLFCENFVTSKRNLPFFLELTNGVIIYVQDKISGRFKKILASGSLFPKSLQSSA